MGNKIQYTNDTQNKTISVGNVHYSHSTTFEFFFFLWNWRIPLLFTFSLNALYRVFFKLYVFCQEIKTDSADIGQIRRNKKYPQSHPQGFFMVDVYHFSRFLYIHIMLFSTSASNAGLINCLTWGLAFIAPHAYFILRLKWAFASSPPQNGGIMWNKWCRIFLTVYMPKKQGCWDMLPFLV